MSRRVSIIAFVLIAALLFWFASALLAPCGNDGVLPLQDLYHYPKDLIDVFLVGSSHSGINLNAALMYKDYGIAAYSLWGSTQPFWNSYYYINEGLKTQSPRIIVLDTMAATFNLEYEQYRISLKNIFGMRFSQDKLEAIAVSAPPEQRFDLISGGIWSYHFNYELLNEDSFHQVNPFYKRDHMLHKHTYTKDNCVLQENGWDSSYITDTAPIFEKQQEYLIKIIERCREENIDIVLITTPYVLPDELSAKKYNSVAELAKEYSVPYINYNLLYDEIGFDFATDMVDHNHLNRSGQRKVTTHLSSFLKQNYSIPDRRGNEDYVSWEDFAVYNKEYEDAA
ncbi:MAG: SGNH/GDSL hydrolase family protein [Clostridia bacterium]|nr:SGNH/GDSL hydrolase family protein [Clostridia bacterium]